MIVEHSNYIEFLSWKEYGVKIIYTKKPYGSVVEKSREVLQKDFGIENKILIAGKQTHGDHIVCVDNLEQTYFEDTDGFLTKEKELVLFTKYADCMPVFFYDSVEEVLGVVHSGWKGSFQEIAGKAVTLMCQHYGSSPSNIQAVFGVGISKDCYEVGQGFLDSFLAHFPPERAREVFEKKEEKLFFDNQKFIVQTLLNVGLLDKHIFRNELCSFQGNFYSYRREKQRCEKEEESHGRNGAFLYFSSKDFHNK